MYVCLSLNNSLQLCRPIWTKTLSLHCVQSNEVYLSLSVSFKLNYTNQLKYLVSVNKFYFKNEMQTFVYICNLKCNNHIMYTIDRFSNEAKICKLVLKKIIFVVLHAYYYFTQQSAYMRFLVSAMFYWIVFYASIQERLFPFYERFY